MRIPSGLKAATVAVAAFALLGLAPLLGAADADESRLSIAKLAASERPSAERFLVHRRDDGHDEHEDYDDHDHGYHNDEHELEEIEIERVYVEMERASLEAIYGGMELIEKTAKIVADDEGVAALAVVSIKDAFEPEEAIEMLEEVVAKAPSKVARRLARLQLAEIHGEREAMGEVRKHLRALIYGGE